MVIIRPVLQNDLDHVMDLIQDAGPGLTTLPNDRDFIAKKLKKSVRSIEDMGDKPMGESILFVLEDIEQDIIIGVCGVITRIGGFEPYHFNRLTSETKKYEPLNLEVTHKYFQMEKTHSGPSEVCSLFLSPRYRNSPNGRLLSLSRFLFMAENSKIFQKFVIAEMRGVVSPTGESVFWSAVGEKLTGLPFKEADAIYAKDTSFVDKLFPQGKNLISTLPQDAIDIIGEVHPNTVPARHLLEQEGFAFESTVGILEPGPILQNDLENIRTIKKSKLYKVSEISQQDLGPINLLASNSTPAEDFRSTVAAALIIGTDAIISTDVANGLKLKVGDSIRLVSLRPEKD